MITAALVLVAISAAGSCIPSASADTVTAPVSGTVYGADGGASDFSVGVYTATLPRASVPTGASFDGQHFSLSLAPGQYVLLFWPGSEHKYTAVTYGGGSAWDLQDPGLPTLSVGAGGVSGLDIRLPLAVPHSITGRVTDATSGAAVSGVTVQATVIVPADGYRPTRPTVSTTTAADGTYALSLLEGRYSLMFTAPAVVDPPGRPSDRTVSRTDPVNPYVNGIRYDQQYYPDVPWIDWLTHESSRSYLDVRSNDVPRVDAHLQRSDVHVTTPTISGALRLSSRLTASSLQLSANPNGVQYFWYRDDALVMEPWQPSSTHEYYWIKAADVGHRIGVVAVPWSENQNRVPSARVYTGVVPIATMSLSRPKIVGKARAGTRLKLSVDTKAPYPKLAYRWYAGGKPVADATHSAFRVTAAYVGKRITVTVTGTKAGYATVSRTSKATARIKRRH